MIARTIVAATAVSAGLLVLFVARDIVHARSSVTGMVSAPQEPVFRLEAVTVRLDVEVTRGDAVVAGLDASDFAVRDNGVPQQVEVALITGTHAIVAIDTSGSVDGPVLAQQKEAVLEVLSRLDDRDRVSIVAFADHVRVLARASDEGGSLGRLVAPLRAGGGTALHDALVVATSLAALDERPAVLLLFTDGGDTVSWAPASRAVEQVRGHGVAVFPIVPPAASPTRRPGSDGILDPLQHPFWILPAPGDTERLLHRVAQTSGGAVVSTSAAPRLRETFARVLGAYRQRYILSYTPAGVGQGDGWHRVDVSLTRQRGTVRVREGYVSR